MQMRIQGRRARAIVALLATVGLLVVSAPGLAGAAPAQRPQGTSPGLRLAKQATSFDRTAKAAATLAVWEIRGELRNVNTAGRPDVVVAYGGVTASAVVTGDWDGNGSSTVRVVHARSDGQLGWHLKNANSPGRPDVAVAYGRASAVPVTGDWDGDGTTAIGVAFPRTDGQIGWHLRNTNTAGPPSVAVAYGGVSAFAVVTGDWDGNGSDTLGAVYQRSGELEWQLRDATTPGRPDHVFRYGGA